MSKMDGLRKMREDRYAEQQKRAAQAAKASGTPARRPTAPATAAPVEKADEAESEPVSTDEALCGHRNMSGRTCTREQGHAAKSHRYS